VNDDERNRREAMARADEAKRIVNSDIFKRAWEYQREQYIMEATKADTDAAKLRALQKIEVIADVRDALGLVVLNGEVAAKSVPLDID